MYSALVREADRESRSLLEVSVGMGLAFFNSARKVGRQHVLDPYTEDLKPVRDEGFGDVRAPRRQDRTRGRSSRTSIPGRHR